MKEIKGIIVPILTPMHEDETVNYEELVNQIERLIAAGVHGIFVFGTNGEGYILDEEEKAEIIRVAVKAVNGRVPVYAGTGCVSTRDTIRMSRKAKELGADVLSIITPSFAAASQEELIRHYETVANAVDMPILLYNIPARTGNALAPATVQKLSQVANIVGAKDSSGNFDNILQYIEKTRGGDKPFTVLSGNDSLILWTLLAGGKGAIAGCANVFPHTMVSIYEKFTAGDLEGARRAQDSIRPFRDIFKFGNPNTIVKTAVKELGYPVGLCRAPFNSLSPAGLDALRNGDKEFIVDYQTEEATPAGEKRWSFLSDRFTVCKPVDNEAFFKWNAPLIAEATGRLYTDENLGTSYVLKFTDDQSKEVTNLLASVFDAQMSGIAQFIDGARELTPDNWAAFQQEMNDLGLSRIEEIQLAAYQAMYGA